MRWKIFALIIGGILMLNIVSALESPFANKLSYDEETKEGISDFIKDGFNEKYGMIKLSKTFFWIETDKIAEYSLTLNTDQCSTHCSAIGRVKLYQNGKAFDNFKFIDLSNNNLKEIEYKVYIGEEVKDEIIWAEYKNEELKKGEYYWKIEGIKKEEERIDWIATSFGNELTEWATWDVSTATYVGEFMIRTQDGAPQGVSFSSDGTMMYITGASNSKVYQYELTEAWNCSSAVYNGEFFAFTSPLIGQNGLYFKQDGTKMYSIDSGNDAVNEFDLSDPWNVTSAVKLRNLSIVGHEGAGTGVYLSDDGLKLFTIGSTGDTIDQYSMDIAWNISNATYVKEYDVNAIDSVPHDLFFSSDGYWAYMIGSANDYVTRLYLWNKYDIGSAFSFNNFYIGDKEATPRGLFFKQDGTRMYIIGETADSVMEYWMTKNEYWVDDEAKRIGIPDIGGVSAPEVFYLDESWYNLFGETKGKFFGYVWDGNSWITNLSINGSLPDVGFRSHPTVFNISDNWYMITGNDTIRFKGYVLASNRSTWIPNSTIINGLNTWITNGNYIYNTPDVFTYNNEIYLIAGNFDGTFCGAKWDGATWVKDLNINKSLPDIGSYSSPTIYYDEGGLKLISGEDKGGLFGYQYNGTDWEKNLTINQTILTDYGDDVNVMVAVSNGEGNLAKGRYLFVGSYTGQTISMNNTIEEQEEPPEEGFCASFVSESNEWYIPNKCQCYCDSSADGLFNLSKCSCIMI